MPQETVHLAIYEGLADWEAALTVAQLNTPEPWQRRPGRYRVRTVAEGTDPVTSMGGVRMVADDQLGALSPADSAMLILPGSGVWDDGGNEAFAAKAVEFAGAGVPVAAICGAVLGLARAGLLDERDHTGADPGYIAQSGYGGGKRYRDERVSEDGGIITAGPTESVAFARAVLARLDHYTPEALEALYQLHRTGEARYFHELLTHAGAGVAPFEKIVEARPQARSAS